MAATDNEKYEALRSDVERLRADLVTITDTLKDIAGVEGSAAYERVRQAAERARGESDRLARSALREVEQRPMTSIGISFVIGLLLGLLFSRR